MRNDIHFAFAKVCLFLLEKRALRSPFYPPPNQGQEHVNFACKMTSKVKVKNNQNLYTANLSFLLAIFDQGQEHVDFASQNDTNSRPKTVPFFAKKVTQKKRKKKAEKIGFFVLCYCSFSFLRNWLNQLLISGKLSIDQYLPVHCILSAMNFN